MRKLIAVALLCTAANASTAVSFGAGAVAIDTWVEYMIGSDGTVSVLAGDTAFFNMTTITTETIRATPPSIPQGATVTGWSFDVAPSGGSYGLHLSTETLLWSRAADPSLPSQAPSGMPFVPVLFMHRDDGSVTPSAPFDVTMRLDGNLWWEPGWNQQHLGVNAETAYRSEINSTLNYDWRLIVDYTEAGPSDIHAPEPAYTLPLVALLAAFGIYRRSCRQLTYHGDHR